MSLPLLENSKRYNRQQREAILLLSQQTRAFGEVKFQRQCLDAQQQILCDLVIHQQLYAALLLGQGAAAEPAGKAAVPHAQLPAAVAALHKYRHTCSFCECAQRLLLAQQQSGAQTSALPAAALPDASRAQPSSYVSRLLQAASQQQLQQARSMTAQGFKTYLANLMPQLLLLLEMAGRHQHVLANSSSSSSGNGSNGTSSMRDSSACWSLPAEPECKHPQQQQQQQQAGAVSREAGPVSTTAGVPSCSCSCQCTAAAGAAGHPANVAMGCAGGARCPARSPTPCSSGLPPPPPPAPAAAAAAAAPGASAQGCRNGTMLARWHTDQQYPVGSCPIMDLAQLLEAVDGSMTVALLALLHSHVPLLEACVHNYSPGVALAAGWQHWHVVCERLQLTEEQELRLGACIDQYSRSAAACRQLGAALAPEVEAPSLLLAAEQAQLSRSRSPSVQPVSVGADASAEQQQQQQQPSPGAVLDQQAAEAHSAAAAGTKRRRAASKATAVAAAAAVGQGGSPQGLSTAVAGQRDSPEQQAAAEEASWQDLDRMLDRYLQRQHLDVISCVGCVVNTLSQVQLAVAFVAAYPFAPDFMAIAAAAREAMLQRQQQRLDLLEQSVLRQHALVSDDAAAPAPAPTEAAAGGDHPPPAAKGARGRPKKGRPKAAPGAAAAAAVAAATAHAAVAAAAATVPRADPQGSRSLQRGVRDVQVQETWLLQTVTQQHVQARAAQLQEHEQQCWQGIDSMQLQEGLLQNLSQQQQQWLQVWRLQQRGQRQQGHDGRVDAPTEVVAAVKPEPMEVETHGL